MTSSTLTFPVCTFKRVFDTTPVREVLTLSELARCFRRFELKPQLHARVEREVQRIDRALDQALSSDAVGERISEIALAGRGAPDPARAMRAKAEEMRVLARKEAKRDLRLWSPALYREGVTERGSEGVSHVSCLVLDYDAGARIPEATAPFAAFFHLVHTTWSHTPAHPKFRVILPLVAPVPAAKWEELWKWAHKESGGEIDVAMSGYGANYALPATPYRDAPREAHSNPAPLLDPRDLGIEVGEPVRLPPLHAPVSVMLGDPEKEYVEEGGERALYVYDDPIDDWDEPSRSSVVMPEPELPQERISEDGVAGERISSERLSIGSRITSPDDYMSALAGGPRTGVLVESTDGSGPSARAVDPRVAPEIAPPLPRTVGRVRTKRVAKKTIVVDFDGVLHSYVSGWKGATVVPDAPVDGAFAWLESAIERFDVAVHSSRSREKGGIEAMREWFLREGLAERVLDQLKFPRSKVPAHVYIDDRGWRFEGTFPALDALDAFEPWFKRKG